MTIYIYIYHIPRLLPRPAAAAHRDPSARCLTAQTCAFCHSGDTDPMQSASLNQPPTTQPWAICGSTHFCWVNYFGNLRFSRASLFPCNNFSLGPRRHVSRADARMVGWMLCAVDEIQAKASAVARTSESCLPISTRTLSI